MEEEKKSDDASHAEVKPLSSETPNTESTGAPVVQEETKPGAKKEETTPKKSGRLGQGVRFFLLDLPLFVLLVLYAILHLAEYAKEELFSAQYEGVMWDGYRKAEEIT